MIDKILALRAFFHSRATLTKHLIRKQKEINALREEIEELQQTNKKHVQALRTINDTIKAEVGHYFWY